MLRLISTASNATSEETQEWDTLEVYVSGGYTICAFYKLGKALFEVQYLGERFGCASYDVFEGDVIPSVEEALDRIILWNAGEDQFLKEWLG